MGIYIGGWQWDEGNLSHLATEGRPSRPTVLQVAQERPRFRENTSGQQRSATHQMIGPDGGGAFWTVCIVQVPTSAEVDIWRAITGWRSDEEEVVWYGRQSP